jgi:hypothetical protein
MKPHKHAELIKAWADGAEIQWKHDGCTDWQDTIKPDWNPDANYRIKPEPKPDHGESMTLYACLASIEDKTKRDRSYIEVGNFHLVWDGETGKIKSAEVLK